LPLDFLRCFAGAPDVKRRTTRFVLEISRMLGGLAWRA
jgi:hypothetical protein